MLLLIFFVRCLRSIDVSCSIIIRLCEFVFSFFLYVLVCVWTQSRLFKLFVFITLEVVAIAVAVDCGGGIGGDGDDDVAFYRFVLKASIDISASHKAYFQLEWSLSNTTATMNDHEFKVTAGLISICIHTYSCTLNHRSNWYVHGCCCCCWMGTNVPPEKGYG